MTAPTRHTPEPWRLDADGGSGQYFNIRHNAVCSGPYLGHETDDGTAKQNAARIVACVNALAGFDPSAIRRLVEAAEDLVQADSAWLADGTDESREAISHRIPRLRAALAAVKGKK